MTESSAQEKLDFKKILPIWIVILVDILGLTVIIPLLPLYAAKFQVSPVMIGVLAASYPLCQFIAAPIIGRFSDRYGRKPVLIVSQIGTLIGFLILGFANTFLLLLLSRIIDGISGGNIATAQAMITDSTTEKTRTQGLGLIGAAFGLGFILGPLIAFSALALSGNNYQTPAFIAAFLSFCSILLTIFLLQETQHPEHRNEDAKLFNLFAVLQALTLPQIGLLLILKFAEQFAFGGFESIVPLFQTSRLGLNASGNSLVFVFIGVLVTIIQGGLIGKLSRKFSERQLILGGLLILAVGLGMIALTPHQTVPWYSKTQLQEELNAKAATNSIASVIIPKEDNKGYAGFIWVLAAMIPCAFGASIMQPSINSLLTKNATPRQRGEILGYSSSYFSLANVFAPLFGFTVLQYFGMNAPLWIWAGLLVALFLWAFVILKSPKESSQRSESSL
jgi:DHA1 family tetracycline resistance protein-like MFS transporter